MMVVVMRAVAEESSTMLSSVDRSWSRDATELELVRAVAAVEDVASDVAAALAVEAEPLRDCPI